MSKNNNFNGFGSKSYYDMFGMDPSDRAKALNKRMYARHKAEKDRKKEFDNEMKKWEEDVQKPWPIVRKDD
jgi:hypothetical protein